MKTINTLILALAVMLTTGCVNTLTIVAEPDELLNEAEQANLVVFRKHSLQAVLSDAYVGTQKGYFVRLSQDQYFERAMPSGFYEFKAGTHGSVSSSTGISLNKGETVCLEAAPNHEELEVLIVPFLNALVPSFVLKERECPSADELKQLTKV